MNNNTPYTLQRYSGISTRHTCPGCGRKRCFTLYISKDGEPLHETVGRCDHESSCGYHYTPKQYFLDHPTAKKDWLMQTQQPQEKRSAKWQVQKPSRPIDTIPEAIVAKTIRPDIPSHLITYLATFLAQETINSLISKYRLGVTKSHDIIYWQTDIKGRTRTGKIMKYDPATGHRIKTTDTPGKINWAHAIMKKAALLPQDWQLTQCLFGEHLLPQHPDTKVALVESEKTAIICSALMPDYLWLATGGKSQLSEERLNILKGRTVIAFPDIDAYSYWHQKLSTIPNLNITISNYLDSHATPQQREAHIDIADLLLVEAEPPCPTTQNTIFQLISKYISPEQHTILADLIKEFDLVPLKVVKINSLPK